MTLSNLSEAELIASAGGDPWAINQSLQAGSPFQIDRLAQAFHNAGRCTAAASEEFAQARKRFEAAWTHEEGPHPINESEEVQQVTKALGYQSEKLPKIGLDLENVATALAAAQRAGADEIAALDRQLHVLDVLIGAAKKDLTLALPANEREKLEKLINDAHADAVDDVRDALKQMLMIRGLYTDVLDTSRGTLAGDGYDPSLIWGVDGHQPQRPAPHGAGPSIDGPATPPKMEGQNTGDQDDLDVSIPGTGIALGGDGKHGFPHIHVPGVYDGKNPLPVPRIVGRYRLVPQSGRTASNMHSMPLCRTTTQTAVPTRAIHLPIRLLWICATRRRLCSPCRVSRKLAGRMTPSPDGW